jgi:hypothetical protein
MRRIFSMILLAAAWPGGLGAQSTAPAEGAAPLEALRELLEAVETGRPDTARGRLHATEPQDRRLAESVVELSAAVARVKQAAGQKFGAGPAASLRIWIIWTRTLLDRRVRNERPLTDPLEGASVFEAGNRARIQFGEEQSDFVLMRRIGGVWKLAIAETLTDPERPSAGALSDAFNAAAVRVNVVAEQIGSGAVGSIDDVWSALESATRSQP